MGFCQVRLGGGVGGGRKKDLVRGGWRQKKGQPIFRSTLIGPKVVLMVVARRVLYLHCCWKASNCVTC